MNQATTLPTQLLEKLIQATSTGILVTDVATPDNSIIFANDAFYTMTGYTPDETIGRNCRFLQGTDHSQREIKVLREAIKAAEHCKVVLRNFRKDKTHFWNELYISPFFNDSGSLTHFIGVQHDVTDAVNQRLNRELFNAGLIHDIKSPLMGQARILEYLAAQEHLRGDKLEGVHDVMMTSLKKSMSQITDTLNYYKLENDLVAPRLQSVNAGRLIAQAIENASEQIKDKRLSIQSLQPDGDFVLTVDVQMVSRALKNLVENAINCSQPGKDIWVLSSANDATAMIAVIDQGSGLPETLKHQLHHSNTEIRSDYSSAAHGSSLGLMTCIQIMRAHGGSLELIKSDFSGTELALVFPKANKVNAELSPG